MKTPLKSTKPVSIILANTPLSNDLQTVFGQQDLSSMVVAGSSIIEHALMELQDLKIEECIVLTRENAAQTQALIGDTRRWGMNITVMAYSLSKEQVLREYKSLSSPHGLLIIEADRLRSRCVEQFLKQAYQLDYSLVEATSAGQPVGVTLLKPSNADFIINAMPVELSGLVTNYMNTTHDFHRVNFDIIVGNFPGLEPSVKINETIGQRQHWASKVHSRAKAHKGEVMIDRHCRVGKDVSLNSVILNHDVYIQKNVSLENTIVMPNAIVGAQQPIKNAIVNGSMIYQI